MSYLLPGGVCTARGGPILGASIAMSTPALAFAATVIILLMLVARYYYFGWTEFEAGNGTFVTWVATDPTHLRFQHCVFTVSFADGAILTRDVTGVLNGMAAGIRPDSGQLMLVKPLNPFSFTLDGINSNELTKATASLKGQWREI